MCNYQIVILDFNIIFLPFVGHFENSHYSPQQSKQIVNFMAHIGAAADRCNLIDSSDQLKQFNDSYDNGSSWVIIQFCFSTYLHMHIVQAFSFNHNV